jgi:hypothetical protein
VDTTPSPIQTTTRTEAICADHGLPVAITVIERLGVTWTFTDVPCPTCKRERDEWRRGYEQRKRVRQRLHNPRGWRETKSRSGPAVSDPRTGESPQR